MPLPCVCWRRSPLLWLGQTVLKFYGRTAIDEQYNGLALDDSEGDRIAAAMGKADILFLKNHGLMVAGASIAEAWDDLYYLERAAGVQLKAMSSNQALKPCSMMSRSALTSKCVLAIKQVSPVPRNSSRLIRRSAVE